MLKEAEVLVDKIIDEQILRIKPATDLIDKTLDEIASGPGGHPADGSGPPEHGQGKGPGKGKQPCKEDVVNENAYRDFFKAELGKQSKSIGQMSDSEKKAFFKSVSAKWKAKKK